MIKKENIIYSIREELEAHADEHTRESGMRFFKEPVIMYGLKSAQVSKIAKSYFQHIKDLHKKDIFGLCEILWQSGMMEESFIACHWSYVVKKSYTPEDFEIFTHWINTYINNWASCDTFCNHTVGTFIEMYPKYLEHLKTFTKSKNRWMRRAASVSLIVPAKQGKFLNDVFEIADHLLIDNDDMVQKGYGWMLKVASQAHQNEVFEYVVKNKAIMPRTALRYAIEKMPSELKAEAMKR